MRFDCFHEGPGRGAEHSVEPGTCFRTCLFIRGESSAFSSQSPVFPAVPRESDSRFLSKNQAPIVERRFFQQRAKSVDGLIASSLPYWGVITDPFQERWICIRAEALERIYLRGVDS